MKAIRLIVDEGTWLAARKLAVRRGTSVSGLVREALQNLTNTYERRERARRQILGMIGTFGGSLGGMPMPSREERNARD